MHLLRRICQSDELFFILKCSSKRLYEHAPYLNGTRTRTGSVVSIQSESIVTLTGIGPWSVDTHLLAVVGRTGTALIIVYKRRKVYT